MVTEESQARRSHAAQPARCAEIYSAWPGLRCDGHAGHEHDGPERSRLHYARWPNGMITWESAQQYAARRRREASEIKHPRASRFRRHPER